MALLSGAKQGIVVGYFVFVAQLDSASDSDSEGRGFESRQTQTLEKPRNGLLFFYYDTRLCFERTEAWRERKMMRFFAEARAAES